MTKLVGKGILANVTAALITDVMPSAAAATASPSILDTIQRVAVLKGTTCTIITK